MKALYKKGDELTPEIDFDPTSSVLTIKGNSIPMDAQHFFSDVISWLQKYSEEPNERTKIEIDLKYLNARSIRTILSLLTHAQHINESGKEVMVEWSVPSEADDLREISEDVFDQLGIPHHIISTN